MDPTVLKDLGLTDAEARAYLELLRHGSLGAPALAEVIDVPRSSVYVVLRSLVDKGLVEGGAGYGSRFGAIAPGKALDLLFRQERELIDRREVLAGRLLPRLEELFQAGREESDEQLVEVLRSGPSISERYDRLQLEAEHSIDVLVKAPAVLTRRGNPAEIQTLKRRVRNRGLYEEQALAAPEIGPYLSKWVAAGEEIRVYDGELPVKMALIDRRAALMALATPGSTSNYTAIIVRHASFGMALGVLFDHLWEQSRPHVSEHSSVTPSRRRASRQRRAAK